MVIPRFLFTILSIVLTVALSNASDFEGIMYATSSGWFGSVDSQGFHKLGNLGPKAVVSGNMAICEETVYVSETLSNSHLLRAYSKSGTLISSTKLQYPYLKMVCADECLYGITSATFAGLQLDKIHLDTFEVKKIGVFVAGMSYSQAFGVFDYDSTDGVFYSAYSNESDGTYHMKGLNVTTGDVVVDVLPHAFLYSIHYDRVGDQLVVVCAASTDDSTSSTAPKILTSEELSSSSFYVGLVSKARLMAGSMEIEQLTAGVNNGFLNSQSNAVASPDRLHVQQWQNGSDGNRTFVLTNLESGEQTSFAAPSQSVLYMSYDE